MRRLKFQIALCVNRWEKAHWRPIKPHIRTETVKSLTIASISLFEVIYQAARVHYLLLLNENDLVRKPDDFQRDKRPKHVPRS